MRLLACREVSVGVRGSDVRLAAGEVGVIGNKEYGAAGAPLCDDVTFVVVEGFVAVDLDRSMATSGSAGTTCLIMSVFLLSVVREARLRSRVAISWLTAVSSSFRVAEVSIFLFGLFKAIH